MIKFTNMDGIPLSLAVWLMQDDYDYSTDPNTISVTSLLKPIKSIILKLQNPKLNTSADIIDLLPSRRGTALHTAIESAWENIDKVKESLILLGYPKKIIDNIIINPTKEELTTDSIPIYMEQRATKKVGNYTISGKFDFVLNGKLEDFKSTKVYSYLMQSNNDKYIQQGSIYRWLNPDIITNDVMSIQYIFTDWNQLESIKNVDYPKSGLKEQSFKLMSLNDTDVFVNKIISNIDRLKDKPQNELPQCTPEELWVSPSIWKYYKDPNKTNRSTKNFKNSADAYLHKAKDGNIGKVVEIPGQVKRCKYCSVINICTQAKGYKDIGILNL